MNDKFLITQLDDEQVDDLLGYAPPYSQHHSNNIKNNFMQKIGKKKKNNKKILLTAGIASIFLLFTGFAYAGIIDLNQLYSIVFGKDSQYMTSYGTIVNGGNESEGIQLDMLSVIKDENVLYAFFTLTDKAGDRLGEKVDLYDSWRLNQGHGGGCQVIDYDPVAKKSTLLITSQGASTNKTATLTFSTMLTGREDIFGLKENIDIIPFLTTRTASISPKGKESINGGGGLEDGYEDGLSLLARDEVNIPFSNIDWSYISNIGFVNGDLHIQANPSNTSQNVIRDLYFVDDKDEVVYKFDQNIYFGQYFNGEYSIGGDYIEYVYKNIHDVSQLENLSMVMDVMVYGDLIKGDWKATFKVPPQADHIKIPGKEVMIDDTLVTVDKMILSPLGLTIKYTASNHNDSWEDTNAVSVKYDDGFVEELASCARYEDGRRVTITFSNDVIQIEKVKSVFINGQEIKVESKGR